mgnify:CR=1 FL=1
MSVLKNNQAVSARIADVSMARIYARDDSHMKTTTQLQHDQTLKSREGNLAAAEQALNKATSAHLKCLVESLIP